jgi:hypothetical protein
MNEIQPLLDLLGGKLPWLPTIIVWLGALKLFFHFTGGFIQSQAAAFMVRIVDSEDPNDDHFLLVILDSRIYQFIRFLLQVASLPLPARADYDLMLKKRGLSAGAIVPLLLFFLFSPLFFFGCAHIQAGQDPIVVMAERAQTYAASTFDLILETDDANRPLFRERIPAYHDFCEWLRQPQLASLADGTPHECSAGDCHAVESRQSEARLQSQQGFLQCRFRSDRHADQRRKTI